MMMVGYMRMMGTILSSSNLVTVLKVLWRVLQVYPLKWLFAVLVFLHTLCWFSFLSPVLLNVLSCNNLELSIYSLRFRIRSRLG
jgi:hypothetical protein